MAVDEYLRLRDKPYWEYREGSVSQKVLPTKLHAIIQRALLMLPYGQGAPAFPELTVRISPTKYLVPDVGVAADFPALSDGTRSAVLRNPISGRPWITLADDGGELRRSNSLIGVIVTPPRWFVLPNYSIPCATTAEIRPLIRRICSRTSLTSMV